MSHKRSMGWGWRSGGVVAILLTWFTTVPVEADVIYMLHNGNDHPMVLNARTHLTNLGHAIDFSQQPLEDYTGYDQVWDLRFNVNLTGQDATSMSAYLAGGGRMYLTGEHLGAENSRNISLRNWIAAVGGGAVGEPRDACGPEDITPEGQIVNAPNPFAQVQYRASTSYQRDNITRGFLVSEEVEGTERGSLIGWDFGDITNAPHARMLVGFDIEIFHPDNGQAWTENMFTYLALECPADLDGDGEVAFRDLLIVLAFWGDCPPKCLGDIDGNGIVDIGDLLFVLSSWGPCE